MPTPQYREKYVDLRTSGETGVSEAIRFGAGHVKTASIKLDLLDAVLRDAVDRLRPTEGKLYVLVYAMGAGEYWGANRNSDYFPEKVLSGEDPDNGYLSFLKAGIFRDHALNKQLEHSFGRVMLSVYNRRMHRIELLIEVDRIKAAAEGHQDLIDRLDAGEPVPVSMGCRTPVDICFPEGTLVSTSQGQRRIEEVELGDPVLTHSGSMKPATQLFSNPYTGEMVTLHPVGVPDPITATANHPMLVLRSSAVRGTCQGSVGGRPRRHAISNGVCTTCHRAVETPLQWIPAGEIQQGDYLAYVPPSLGPVEPLTTKERARWKLLGYYLGDGNIITERAGKGGRHHDRDMGFAVTVATADEGHIEDVLTACREAELKNEPTTCLYKGKAAISIRVYDGEFALWLQAQCGRGSRSKTLPVLSNPEALLTAIGAYIDCDGSQDHNTQMGTVRMVTTSVQLGWRLREALLSLGIFASLNRQRTKSPYSPEPVTAYFVVVPGGESGRLAPYARKVTAYPKSRRSQSLFIGGTLLAPVKRVTREAVEGVPVYNLSVEEDESYTAGGFTAHNCSECGHHSKVDADRCDCIRTRRNTILPDGRLVCMINPMCKAFDLSFVTIGADPSALTIAKLARFGGVKAPPYKPMPSPVARNKVASSKLAELIKKIPGMAAAQGAESSIPSGLLSDMASKPLTSSLSSAGALGIVLKPSEFQRIVLMRQGKGAMADELDRARVSIPQGMWAMPGAEVSAHELEQRLIDSLRSVARERSAYEPSLRPRIHGMAVKVASARYRSVQPGENRVLDAIGCLYTGYRDSLLEKIATDFNKVASHDPSMLNTMYPDELGLLDLVKVGSTVRRNDMAGALTLPYLLTHVYSRGGEDAVAEYVTSHPEIVSAYLGIL